MTSHEQVRHDRVVVLERPTVDRFFQRDDTDVTVATNRAVTGSGEAFYFWYRTIILTYESVVVKLTFCAVTCRRVSLI